MRTLGLRPGRYDTLRRHIVRLGVDASHLKMTATTTNRRGRWTDTELAAVVAESTSYADVMRRLGYRPSGGIHRWISGLIRSQGLSTAHFTSGPASPMGGSGGRRRSMSELLVD